ncbi:sulfotransferase domain-containing protein [Microcoleus sp. CAWBG58]|uniref:sulfotransferase domain-containing protein n=1 Tax=Microcoleus sp. CAWBG58 TaxID=2841651 RepID=UPI0025F0C376|nr:sulfotransferase domain-containing protein [Microcoleus sp. CAWBG58]
MKQPSKPPDFIIIGVQKGGTTSLYNYLIQHPQIAPAAQKEIHYFDLNFDKSPDWYYSQFPQIQSGEQLLTGEASPYYIFHPRVAQRIHDLCPKVKIIALLRNPVERAISHYHYYIKIGYESLSLESAIAQEPERLKGEIEKILASPTYESYNHRHYTYLSRGIYADQLPAWMQLFPKSQLLILKSEDLYVNPCGTYNSVLKFLGLPPHELETYEKYNSNQYPPVSETVYEQLRAYYRSPNQRLAQLCDRDFGWD